MMSNNIDYVTTYFEYPTLTKIHGEPTYKTLRELKKRSKVNAATVTSDLVGVRGVNIHLELVCTPAKISEYQRYIIFSTSKPWNISYAG